MSDTINLDTHLFVDKNGNAYIDNYLVSIDKNDCIEFIKTNEQQNGNKYANAKKLKPIELKVRMINDELDKIRECDGENMYDDDEEDDEEDRLNIQHYISNPETKYVEYKEDNDDEDDSDDITGPYYNIDGEYNESSIEMENAMYETYYIDSEKVSHVIFYTTIRKDNPIYRISFYTNNIIMLNIIGSSMKYFKMNCEMDENNIKNISATLVERIKQDII